MPSPSDPRESRDSGGWMERSTEMKLRETMANDMGKDVRLEVEERGIYMTPSQI